MDEEDLDMDALEEISKPQLDVLYEEDGKAILWISKIFPPPGLLQVCKENKEHAKTRPHLKDRTKSHYADYFEEDDYVQLRSGFRMDGVMDLVMQKLREASAGLGDHGEDYENSQACLHESSNNLDESWLDHILWDNGTEVDEDSSHAKVMFKFPDNTMIFEIPEGKSGVDLRTHAAAMAVFSRSQHPNKIRKFNQLNTFPYVSTNNSDEIYYPNRIRQGKSRPVKLNVHGIEDLHSVPAKKLETMKPLLSNKDLANFHRPKAVWVLHHSMPEGVKVQREVSPARRMMVTIETMGRKRASLTVNAFEPLGSMKEKLLRRFPDLETSEKIRFFYCGKELESRWSLLQQKVKPSPVLHLVRTTIHPWPKSQTAQEENKPTCLQEAFQKISDLSVKDGHVFVTEYSEERPLLVNNVGMGARLCTYCRESPSTDSSNSLTKIEQIAKDGLFVPLEPTEESPFYLGEIRPGGFQACLETNMFRAPAFLHSVASTDFLLVRSVRGKLSLRRIDRSYVIGQQEPYMEVLHFGMTKPYLLNLLLTFVYRQFQTPGTSGYASHVRVNEVRSQLPFAKDENVLRKHLNHCADLQRDQEGEKWLVMKRGFRLPAEEELQQMLTPEAVCAFESMQAGLHRLKTMGLKKLRQADGLNTAKWKLSHEARMLETASQLETELQLTPWNLSRNFVAVMLQEHESLEKLEIIGAGDPSGRGLGFSYLGTASRDCVGRYWESSHQLQQQIRQECQERWDRQVKSLSATSRDEATNEHYEFAQYLEDMLQRGESIEAASIKAKKERNKLRAWKRGLQARQQGDSKDELADTADFPDVRSQTTIFGRNKASEKQRIVHKRKPDGEYYFEEIIIDDPNRRKTKKNGEGGNQLVCGACKQVGHIRTNKSCPMYVSRAKDSIAAAESIESSEPPARQGIYSTRRAEGIEPSEPPARQGIETTWKTTGARSRKPFSSLGRSTPHTTFLSRADEPKVDDEGAKVDEDAPRLIERSKVQKIPSNVDDTHENIDDRNSNYGSALIQVEEETSQRVFYSKHPSPIEAKAAIEERLRVEPETELQGQADAKNETSQTPRQRVMDMARKARKRLREERQQEDEDAPKLIERSKVQKIPSNGDDPHEKMDDRNRNYGSALMQIREETSQSVYSRHPSHIKAKTAIEERLGVEPQTEWQEHADEEPQTTWEILRDKLSKAQKRIREEKEKELEGQRKAAEELSERKRRIARRQKLSMQKEESPARAKEAEGWRGTPRHYNQRHSRHHEKRLRQFLPVS
ncbi:hypothetical protein GOP47_0027303 [Adiantum capillus-veneris]|nr:hypothetical protein GOP47_0027303 [Adiantum capillus-veneris]